MSFRCGDGVCMVRIKRYQIAASTFLLEKEKERKGMKRKGEGRKGRKGRRGKGRKGKETSHRHNTLM